MKTQLALIILILWVGLFIRAHNITALPIFTDEYSHIDRATEIYDFDHHPAKYGSGKFLLYLLLGVVDLTERDTALFLSRTLVALTALIIGAVVFRIAKYIFDADVALLATAFYMLVPYAFFYERMALADSLAGLMGIITVWWSLRLAENPSVRFGILVGTFAALSVAAKMTLGLAVGFPVAAVLILGQYDNLRHAFRKYMPYLVVSGITFIILWSLVLVPALIERLQNPENTDIYLFVNPDLTEDEVSGTSVGGKLAENWEKLALLASVPMGLVLIGLALIGLWRYPRQQGYLLACLALTWAPSVILATNLQTRYMMSGVPIMALLLSGGLSALLQTSYRPMGLRLATAGMVVWAVLFSFPFAYDAMTNPPELDLPDLDERNYFWHLYNGYGSIDAMDYLRENGERHAEDEPIYLVGLMQTCPYLDLQEESTGIEFACPELYRLENVTPDTWENMVLAPLRNNVPVYILSDRFDVPPNDTPFAWEKVEVFPKPQDRIRVTIWRAVLET